ncbi:MAG TPA: heme-degrading domain-containing protein [Candidatus Eisenbacteria bacterium]|nr:heme-degrading domain-containing protein [Candidatus Eisenbacteria bacterium]
MGLTEDLAAIAAQERELQFPEFHEVIAWQLGSRLRELAIAKKFGVVIDVRRFGQPLFYTALPGTTADNPEWVRRKGNVVARFHRSSYAIGLELQQSNSTLLDKYGLPQQDYAVHGGSFPIRVPAAGVIGSVTVSGVPQRSDHELVVEALCAELGRDYASLRLPSA